MNYIGLCQYCALLRIQQFAPMIFVNVECIFSVFLVFLLVIKASYICIMCYFVTFYKYYLAMAYQHITQMSFRTS